MSSSRHQGYLSRNLVLFSVLGCFLTSLPCGYGRRPEPLESRSTAAAADQAGEVQVKLAYLTETGYGRKLLQDEQLLLVEAEGDITLSETSSAAPDGDSADGEVAPVDPNEPVVSGYVRFIGPVAAGCNVSITLLNDTTVNTTTSDNGAFAFSDPELIERVVVMECVDTFTGLPIPFPVTGLGSADGKAIQVTPVTTIAQSEAATTAGAAYAFFGISGWTAALETQPLNVAVANGSLEVAGRMILADIQISAVYNVLNLYIANLTAAQNQTACNTTMNFIQAAAANASTLLTGGQMTFTSAKVTALINAVATTCNVTVDDDAAKVATTIATITSAAVAALTSEGGETPVMVIANVIRVGSFAASLNLTAAIDFATLSAAKQQADFDGATIVPSALYNTMSTGFSDAQATITVRSVGPLSGATVVYKALHAVNNVTLGNTTASGTIDNPAAAPGVYLVSAGAVDIFLTADKAAPVRTIFPVMGISGVGSAGGSVVISPISGLVFAKWMMSVNARPSLTFPHANDTRMMYDSMLKQGKKGQNDTKLPEADDYQARTFKTGTGAALAVLAVDTVLAAVTGFGGKIIASAINGSDPMAVAFIMSNRLSASNVTDMSNVNTTISILTDVYNSTAELYPNATKPIDTDNAETSPTETTPAAVTRRRLLALPTSLATLISAMATTIADSNAVAAKAIDEAAVAISSGTIPSKEAFLTTMQVATLQQTVVSQKIQTIATAIAEAVAAGGDISAAVTAAEESLAEVQGDKLIDAISNTPVNLAELESIANPPAEATPEAGATTATVEAKKNSLALGVGLGVGLGAAALVGVAAGMYIIKKRRGAQEVSPAPAA